MMMASTAALPPTINSVSGVTTPTMLAPAALVASAGNDSSNHNQKDTTFTKIFVGGLPYHTNDKSLREHFEVFGEIDEAVVITDRQTGKSRGYGFVTMADRSGAERAIKDPNPVIDGRKANVNLAYIGAKPRGTPGTNYTSVLTSASPAATAAAMRLYAASQIPGAAPHFSYGHAAGGNYLYALQYPYAHPPTSLMPTQTTAHLAPASTAAALGYSPDFGGTAGYTTTGYPSAAAAQTVLDPFTMAALPGFSYFAHPATANAFTTLGAAAYQTAGSTQQATSLQEARMQ